MIPPRMPSPIGHSIAGAMAAWTADLIPGDRSWRSAPAAHSWYRRAGDGLTLVCAALGALADVDLLSPTPAHRAYTHGVGAVILVTIIAAAVTGWVTRKAGLKTGDTKRINTELTRPTEKIDRQIPVSSVGSVSIILRVALMCGGAYATHVLLDWLAFDDTAPYGIRALWPFSDRWYISGWNLFPGTARRHVLSYTSLVQNAYAIAIEIAILVPIAWGVWRLRARAFRHAGIEAAPRAAASRARR